MAGKSEKRDSTLRLPASPHTEGTGTVRRFRLTEAGGGEVWQSSGERCAIGSHALNDLVLKDPTVSRFHCEVRMSPEGPRARDLGSLNGTFIDGVPVAEAFLRSGSLLKLGNATLRFDLATGKIAVPLSARSSFGALVGSSVAMRQVFALLERAAQSDSTVLLEGPTGTGKGQAALALHESGARRKRPFVVIDCGAAPASLLESLLFGHERGAFTGAEARRSGAFEAAEGGTIFLDEIGELPLELQPKFLRVLEDREFRPVGAAGQRKADVRVIAATNRDLRAEVNAGRFRSDLYFRLAVVRVQLPSLSQHPEDMPLLVEQILRSLHAPPERAAQLSAPRFVEGLTSSAWPGNVRELRNVLERALVLGESAAAPEESGPLVDLEQGYAAGRKRALDEFERRFVAALLERHAGKAPAAAKAAGMDVKYLYRLIKRHGLR